MGVGWSLEGLSAISRCPKTKAQDGYGRGVGWGNGGDAFCLDGQRLTAISGEYGHNGTEYRTEIDTFTKIVSVGQTGPAGNPESFIAYTKAGDTLFYGMSKDSSMYFGLGTQPRKYKWAVKLIVDRSFNAIVVNYGTFILPLLSGSCSTCNTEEIWPKSISYGGQVSPVGGVPMDREVRFIYTRDRPDPLVGYTSPGIRVSRSRLLERVETYVESTLVRSYDLSYEEAPVPQPPGGAHVQGESRLIAIAECAQDKISLANVQMQCAAPTTFEYGYEEGFHDPPLVVNLGAGISQSSPHAPIVVARGDVTGDGLDDLLFRPNGAANTTAIARATGNRSAPLATLPSPKDRDLSALGAMAVRDHNGDGKQDLLGQSPQFVEANQARFDLLVSSFGSFVNDSVSIPLRVSNAVTDRYAAVDVDGDDHEDFLVCSPSGDLSYFPRVGIPGGLYFDLPEHGDCSFLVRHPQTLDVDGDGVPNLVAVRDNDWAFLRHQAPLGWESFEIAATEFNLGAGRLKFGDVNGDGLTDVIELGNPSAIFVDVPADVILHINTGGGRVRTTGHTDEGYGPSLRRSTVRRL